MKILVLNSGSSSIKFKLFEDEVCLASGLVEKISEPSSYAKLKIDGTGKIYDKTTKISSHEEGLEIVMELFKQSGMKLDLDAVGHRVVQGGSKYLKPTLLNEKIVKDMESLIPLAPLHNPAHIAGIKSMLHIAPNVPNVAVFDTSFHQSMPEFAYTYALPKEFKEKYFVRRYGAHGTSHEYVSHKAAHFLGKTYRDFSCVTLHLGNGASVSAIENGKCLETSMGLTPLEGLMMGTRCGDIDPAILPYLKREAGIDVLEMDNIMNKKSGLFAICGSNDMRDIEARMEQGDKDAKLAFEMFCHRIKKYLGAYLAVLGKADAIIFTAGIGENDKLVRQKVCENLEFFGIKLDQERNYKTPEDVHIISTIDSKVKILIVRTDEELAIVKATSKVLNQN